MEVGTYYHGFCNRTAKNLRGGNNAIWVIVNRLTKSAHFLPMKVNFSMDCLAFLYVREIVRMHGVPVFIISYRDLVLLLDFGIVYRKLWVLS